MDTYASWSRDRTIRLGAGLAYYSLFTLVPLIALTVAVAAALFDSQEVESYLAERLADAAGVEAEAVAAAITAEISRRSLDSSLGVIGFAGLLFASSLIFVALEDAVNSIWHVPVEPGLTESLRRRAIAFALVGATGALLIAGFAVSEVTAAIEAAAMGDRPGLGIAVDVIGRVVSGLGLVGAIAALFRYLGPQRLRWRTALSAALPTALVLTLSTWLTGWYFREWGSPSVTGALGALIVVLTWIYFEAQVLLAGVQLAKTMAISVNERSQLPNSSSDAHPG